MKIGLLATLLVYAYTRELYGYYSSSNSYCYTCIASSYYYWCAEKANSSSGYCCSSGQSKYSCLGSDYQDYVCSNEGLSGRAENLLCPKEDYDCQDTNDFDVIWSNDTNYVETSIVSPGRTCEYRTYISSYSYSSYSTYNVTIEVDYVYSQTYLGVYQYHTDSNTYDLVREVDQYFTGNISTTMDSNTDVYVQMHPFTSLSCAAFTVHADGTSSSSSNSSSSGTGESNGGGKKLSTLEILLIVFSIIIFLILLVGFVLCAYCFCSIYDSCFKDARNTPVEPYNEPEPVPGVRNDTKGVLVGMQTTRIGMNGTTSVPISNFEGNRYPINNSVINSTRNLNPQDQNAESNSGNPDAKVQHTEAVIGQIIVSQQELELREI